MYFHDNVGFYASFLSFYYMIIFQVLLEISTRYFSIVLVLSILFCVLKLYYFIFRALNVFYLK
jgi:hypothetical protein